jgi:nitrogen regulatory protein PII
VQEEEETRPLEGRGYPMKLIVAIIRPEALEGIRVALDEPEVSFACISHAHVIDGHAPSSTAIYRGVTVHVPHPRLRLEVVVVNDALVSWVLDAIIRVGHRDDSASMNDAKVFVMPLDEPGSVAGRKLHRVAA